MSFSSEAQRNEASIGQKPVPSASGHFITIDSNVLTFAKMLANTIGTSGATYALDQNGTRRLMTLLEPKAWCDQNQKCSDLSIERSFDDQISPNAKLYSIYYDTPLSTCSYKCKDLISRVLTKSTSFHAFIHIDVTVDNYSFDVLCKNLQAFEGESTVFIEKSATFSARNLNEPESFTSQRKEKINMLKGTRTIMLDGINCSRSVIARTMSCVINSFLFFGYVVHPASLTRMVNHHGSLLPDLQEGLPQPEFLSARTTPYMCDPYEFSRLGLAMSRFTSEHHKSTKSPLLPTGSIYVFHDDSDMLELSTVNRKHSKKEIKEATME